MDGIIYKRQKAKGNIIMKEALINGEMKIILEQTIYSPEDGSPIDKKHIQEIDEETINKRINHLQEDIAGYQEMLADLQAIKSQG